MWQFTSHIKTESSDSKEDEGTKEMKEEERLFKEKTVDCMRMKNLYSIGMAMRYVM